MDLLNLVKNINHHWQAYGNWSFALDDYLELHLMRYINTPIMQMLADIEDPYLYKDRLTMPKYIIAASGDEFFLPDDTRYYLNDLLGEVHYRLVPNAEHSLVGHVFDITLSIETFFHSILLGKSRPSFSFNRDTKTQVITLKTIDKPTKVKMWHAFTIASTGRRDFRLLVGTDPKKDIQPIFWFERELSDQGSGVYIAQMDTPTQGWVGFFIEVEYKVGPTFPIYGDHYFKFTSELSVLPDTFPFPPCGDHCQP